MAIGTGAAILAGTLGAAGISAFGASESASAVEEAAATSADAQTAQLEYLKEINALPQELKEQALTQLGSLYGLGDADSATAQADLVSQVQSSPFYESMLQTGQEAVLTGASATGGLRSGSASEALAESSQDVLQSLYSQQVSGLSGLAGLSTGESEIGQVISNIGTTEAAGVTDAAQVWQDALSNISNIGLSGLGQSIEQGVI